ncbi:MAG: L17 family ribosomal protein [Candidatus Shapirobacteria bacterium]|nr:L17 family ribosomal protein [Candidatus Shapirobacteria bacterium]
MNHRIFGKKLSRNHHERQALLRSLTRNIFTHGGIETTEAKAKAVIPLIERLSSTIMSKPELTAKRELFRHLQDQTWVNTVVSSFKSVFEGQTSNFTKVIKIKRRMGDDSLIVKLAFIKPVDFKIIKKVVEEPKKKTVKAKVATKVKKIKKEKK